MSATDSDSSSMLLGAAATSMFHHSQQPPQQCFVCHMRFTYAGFLAHLQSETHRENLGKEQQRQRRTDWSQHIAGGSGGAGGSFNRPDPSELRLSPRLLADSDDSRFGRQGGKGGGGSGGRGNGFSSSGRASNGGGHVSGGDRVKRLLSRDADRHRRTEALLAETASKIRQFRQERSAASAATSATTTSSDSRHHRQDRRHRPEPVGDADAAVAAAADSGSSTCRTVSSAASATSSLLTSTTAAAAAAAAGTTSSTAATSTAATTTTVTPLETVRSNDDFEQPQPSHQRSLTKLLRDAAVLTDSPPTPSAPPSSRRSDSATQFPTPRDESMPTPPLQTRSVAASVAFEVNEDASAAATAAASASPTSAFSSARRSREVERMQAALELSLQEDELEAGIEEVDGRIAQLMEQIEQLRAGIQAEEAVKQELLEKKGALTQRRVAILKESFHIPEDALFAQFASLSPRPSQQSPFQPSRDSTPRDWGSRQQRQPRLVHLEEFVMPDDVQVVTTPRLLDGVADAELYDDDEEVDEDAVDDAEDAEAGDDGSSTDTVRHQLVQKVLDSDQTSNKQQPQSVDSPRDAELINSTLTRLLQPLPQSFERHHNQQHQPSSIQEAPRRSAADLPPAPPAPEGPPPEVLSDVLSSRSRRSDPQVLQERPASAAAGMAAFPGKLQSTISPREDSSDVGSARAASGGVASCSGGGGGGGGSFRRAASETQLRRSRPRRQDPEFAAALREYLHASSSSDVDLDETRTDKPAGDRSSRQLQPTLVGSAKPTSGNRRTAQEQLNTARSLDSSAAQSSRSSAATITAAAAAVGTSDDAGSSSSAPGLVFPGRIEADEANPGRAVAVRCAAVHQGFLFAATADGAVRRYSLRTHRCLTVYRAAGAAADVSADDVDTAWLILTSTAEPLLFFADGAALVGHDVHTGARLRQRELPSAATATCLRWGAVYVGCFDGRVLKYDVAADSVRTVIESAADGAVTSLEAALQQPGGRRVLLRGCRSTPDLLVADERTGQPLARLGSAADVADHPGPVLAIRVAPGGGVAFALSRNRLLAHRIAAGLPDEAWAAARPVWELPATPGQAADFTCLHLGLRADWLFVGQSDGSVLCFRLDSADYPDSPTVRLTPSTDGSPVTAVAFYDVGRHVVSGDASGRLSISDSLPLPATNPTSSKVPTKVPILGLD